MNFSSIFGLAKKASQPEIACDNLSLPSPITCDSLSQGPIPAQPISGHLSSSQPISGEIEISPRAFFLPTQAQWLDDPWPLRIWEKSRQVGATTTDALDSLLKASHADARFDVWVSSEWQLVRPSKICGILN